MPSGARLLVSEQRMLAIIVRDGHDPETEHLEADKTLVDALRALGYDALCDLYDQVKKWYS
jgi:hypothetical protein